jgi:hypothetical protein
VTVRISFDIGGVLSKHPNVFRPMVEALVRGGAEVFVITDIPDHAKAVALVRGNGYDVAENRILNACYTDHAERCKEQLIREHKIDLHIDDFPAYCAHTACVSLLVWPNPDLPYYADDFVTDGSEGTFGRTKPKQVP